MTHRIYIYPSDIQCLTGKSYRTACRIVRKIKQEKGIKRNILIREYAEYMNIHEDIIRKNMPK